MIGNEGTRPFSAGRKGRELIWSAIGVNRALQAPYLSLRNCVRHRSEASRGTAGNPEERHGRPRRSLSEIGLQDTRLAPGPMSLRNLGLRRTMYLELIARIRSLGIRMSAVHLVRETKQTQTEASDCRWLVNWHGTEDLSRCQNQLSDA